MVLLIGMSLLAGCYQADDIISSRKELVGLTRLEEIDLGEFRVTLPYRPRSTSSLVVDFHAFGRVSHGNYKKVSQTIEQNGPKLRHQMLITVRELGAKELQQPKLDTLRAKIEQVVNDLLEDQAMQAVGFYRFSLRSQ
ncbi:MAG: hypothetical protein ABGX16_00980 [Pirellulales bacterium]